jgi:crossover junction endodeoxyribonuclease RusA
MITLPWPDARLSPNGRVHWAIKSRVVKGARELACYEAKRACLPPMPAEGDIRMVWTFHPPDKRRRDRDNIAASCKAYADGIADALGVDDSRFEPTYRRGEPVRGGRVTVEVLP